MNIDNSYLAKLSTLLWKLRNCGIEDPLIAGGAIRDMLFEKPIKDIDVFYSKGSFKDKPNLLEKTYFTETGNTPPEYEGCAFSLKHNLYNKEFPGIKIQLIKVEDPFKAVNEFPIDLCRVSFGRSSSGGAETLNLPPELLADIPSKKCWHESSTKPDYLEYIKDKYSGWEFYT